MSDVEIGDLDNLDCPMTLAYTVHLRRWARPVHDLLLFRIPWAESATVMGPISAAERAQPLQLPPVLELIEHFQIQLPEGFHGYGVPVEEQAECAGVAYHLTVRSENGCLSCERRMEIRGGIVPTDRFAEFKQFWENCARADQADIVLIRRQPHRE